METSQRIDDETSTSPGRAGWMARVIRVLDAGGRVCRGMTSTLLVVGLAAAVMPGAGAITWTGAGDGRLWSLAGNWDERRVPRIEDDVVIPGVEVPVELVSGTVRVRSVTAKGSVWQRGGTLVLGAGRSLFTGGLILAEGASLEAVGSGVEVGIDGGTVELSGMLSVEDGAVIRLGSGARVRGNRPEWWAVGFGSAIDASAMTGVVLENNSRFWVMAQDEGFVDLSGLGSLRGPVSLRAASRGVVDVSRVQGRWTTEGFYYLGEVSATGGGEVRLPGVTSLDRVEVVVDEGGVIPMRAWTSFTQGRLVMSGREVTWGGVTNIDETELELDAGAILRLPGVTQLRGDRPQWWVEGEGTLIDARALTNIALGRNGRFPIEARNQGRVDLSGLSAVRGPVSPRARTEGVVDLSGLRGRWTTEGFYYLAEPLVETGGRLLMAGVDSMDRVAVSVDASGGLAMRQWVSFTRGRMQLSGAEVVWGNVTNIDDTEIQLDTGAVLRLPGVQEVRGNLPEWQVEGQGSLLDARWVTNILLGVNGRFFVEVRNQGRVDLTGLRSLRGPVLLRAWSAGLIDLSQVTGRWSSDGFYYDGELFASEEGRILMPGLRQLDRVDVTLAGLGQLDSGVWEVLTRSGVEVRGFGAVLSLGNLRNQTGTTFRTVDGGVVAFGNAPRIVSNPVSAEVRPGAALVLEVEAEGDGPLTYQWYKNGQPIAGGTSASLRLLAARPADAGAYSVHVRNGSGLRISEPALVSIDVPAWPFGDTFARRGLILAKEGVGVGSNVNATVELGEPSHAGKQGGRSIWLTWRAPETGVATFETVGSSFDTLLAVYNGSTITGLSTNLVASDDDGGGFFTSRVVFNAEAGRDYEIAVDGYAGAWGEVVLSWTLDPTLPVLPVIVRQPEPALAEVGTSAAFSVEATPAGSFYRWFRNGTAIEGGTAATLAWTAVRAEDAGTYQVEVRSPSGGVIRSREAILDVVDRTEDNPGTSADKLEDLFAGDDGFAFESLPALADPWRPSAGGGGVGVGLPGGQWTDNSQSTRSPGDPIVCDVATTASRWFRLRLKVPAVDAFVLHTEGSEIPAFLAVFTNRLALTLVGCDAAALPDKPAARVTFPARAGVDYLVLVDGVDGATGRIRLNWALEEEPPPVRRPELSFQDGRLVIRMFPLPGTYDWQVGTGLLDLQTLFRTNLVAGDFLYMDPQPAADAARFYHLKPAQ